MVIPFVDLAAMHNPIRPQIDAAIGSVIDKNAYIKGQELKSFEEELAASLGAAAAAGTSCGTSALTLSLRALGVGPGDEVITVVNTAFPTSEAISLARARVVFVDIRPGTFHIDPEGIRTAITDKTRAIIPVHLYGIPAPMDEILPIAEERGIPVVEDVAQAQGARYGGKRLGTLGKIGCFSFFPSKNLGGFGDGGAVAGTDKALVGRVAMLSDHGRKTKFEHEIESGNFRLDALQAAILRVKLPHLDDWNMRRRKAAAKYNELLASVPEVKTPFSPAKGESVYHLYVIRVPDRDDLAAFLKERGISTGLHYPVSLNLQPAYEYLGMGEGSFPEAEAAAREVLSLPMYPDLSEEQIETVCAVIREYYQG